MFEEDSAHPVCKSELEFVVGVVANEVPISLVDVCGILCKGIYVTEPLGIEEESEHRHFLARGGGPRGTRKGVVVPAESPQEADECDLAHRSRTSVALKDRFDVGSDGPSEIAYPLRTGFEKVEAEVLEESVGPLGPLGDTVEAGIVFA